MNQTKRAAMALVCAVLMALTGCTGPGSRASAPRTTDGTGLAVLEVPPMDKTGSDGNFKSLTSEAATSTLPDKLVVYKVKQANVSKDAAAAHARKLGIESDVEDAGERYIAAGSSASFEVDKATGSFDFTTDAFERQSKGLRRTLSDKEYRERAEEFLLGAGLMPNEAMFKDVNRGNVVGTFEDGTWVERPYMVEVRFGHKPIGGVAFDKGVGPKVVVQFGEDGHVIGAMSVWRDVEPLTAYPLKSADAAVSAALDGRAQLFDVGTDDAGVIDEITLSYMNEPLGYDQRYIVPAYILKGSGRGGRRFTGIAQALPDSYLVVDPTLVRPVTAPQSSGKK